MRRFEQLEGRLMMSAAPINLENPYDVNGDGHITPGDVLCIANALNAGEEISLSRDYNRDGKVSAVDALMVTNFINECFWLSSLTDDELIRVRDTADVFGCAQFFPELIELPPIFSPGE